MFLNIDTEEIRNKYPQGVCMFHVTSLVEKTGDQLVSLPEAWTLKASFSPKEARSCLITVKEEADQKC